MSRVLHVVPGTSDAANGMAAVARLLAKERGDAEVVDLNRAMRAIGGDDVEEAWVHGMWLPGEWAACWKALRAGKRLVRMTHGSLSPVYLERQSPWMKRIAGPVERWLLRRASRIVATCEAEKGWIEAYLRGRRPTVEVSDIKRFFDFGHKGREVRKKGSPLHLLYLGRRHPLKGLKYLEAALAECGNVKLLERGSMEMPGGKKGGIAFRAESDVRGDELEKAWEWCDVLALPTLSENFGLVVAEALERGKVAITTDGAPAWECECDAGAGRREAVDGGEILTGCGGRLLYLKGYRDGTEEVRVGLLKRAVGLILAGGFW